MTTTMTVKRQVTIPKKLCDEVGIQPGDELDVRTTAVGGIIIEKPGATARYEATLRAIAKQKIIKGITGDELMLMTRGEPAEVPPLKRK